MTPEERTRRGIVVGMVRLSCGLEYTEDLMADLDQALRGGGQDAPTPTAEERIPYAP